MRFHKAVSSRVLAAEFMTQVGPITVVVAYAPTERSSTEEKDNFYADLDGVMCRINGLVIVMGDFNATVGQEVDRVVGPFGLAGHTSDNGHRLVDFATVHNLCLSNTYFEHKRIHQTSWYPPDPSTKPSLKDYVLVKRRLHSSVLDTRVYRGGDIVIIVWWPPQYTLSCKSSGGTRRNTVLIYSCYSIRKTEVSSQKPLKGVSNPGGQVEM